MASLLDQVAQHHEMMRSIPNMYFVNAGLCFPRDCETRKGVIMGTLLDQADFATKEGVLRKVRQAIIKTAIAVASEASSGVPALDASRLNFAATVLRDPDDGPESWYTALLQMTEFMRE